jgi:fatty-acyl-CoA synthase
MHTGDLAVMRSDGCVAIVGRLKDVVIRGGENIFPREIEEYLHTIPEIAEAQVFGIPDELYGEQLCAWIRLKHGATLDVDSLRAKCKGKIASYKIPSIVRVVDDYPTTASGKVQKFRMREIEVDGKSCN